MMDHPDASPRILPATTRCPSEDETEEVLDLEHYGRFSYSVFLADHPFVMFLGTLLVILICALCDFVPEFGAPKYPDFSTPVMGFEARGTLINKRWRTRLFLKFAMAKELYLPVPSLDTIPPDIITPSINAHCKTLNLSVITSKMSLRSNSLLHKQKRSLPKEPKTLRMCDSPNVYMKSRIEYKTIFGPTKPNANMMNAESLRAVCRLESKVLREFPGYEDQCFKRNVTVEGAKVEECCPSWSVGNYVASLTGRASCQDIQDNDVTRVLERLKHCAAAFDNGTLKENCWDYKHSRPYPYCSNIPAICIQDNAVFNILYYLTDKDFLGKEDRGERLSYTQVFTPRWQRREFSEAIYYKYIEGQVMEEGPVKLEGTDFYFLKFNMFNTKLLADIIYPSIALMIILVVMWFYTESILLTFLLAISVVSALILAYFVYMVVLDLDFFPFLNVTTLIFLVGIGADDAFVFCDVWRQSKADHPGASLRKITLATLKHASLSMFVTSLTTAAAFMANFSSEITTIKLFGLYAGVAILAKFVLMVTWFPAVSIINEIYCTRYSCWKKDPSNKDTDLSYLDKFRAYYEATFANFSRSVFEELLPDLVIRFRIFWIVLFSCLSVAGLVALVAYPGLQLPTSADVQMFATSHPLERYELTLKDKFRFELSPSQESATFPIDVFWGIEPEDYGNQLDPYDYGRFGWDKTFDIVSPESQRWLMAFCRRFRSKDFYAEKAGSEKKCFIEVFYNQSCSDSLVPEVCNYPCCKNSSFPYSKDVLNFCTLSSAYRRKLLRFKVQDNTLGTFIYDPEGNLKGLWIRIMSNIRLSRAYQPAHEFWNRIESWVKDEMRSAPPGMRNGWFMSDLEYYNLQQSLSRGTLLSLSISITTAFAVILLTTWNLLVSFYAILTIIGTISVTIGLLVLNGWKLNILESITMSVAVGVSIDFSMHFGVAYCLAPDKQDRRSRVRYSMSRMGSAITMAAITTFIAGALMMPSDVLSYIQMGHFLMLVMAVSWAFSVFFFQSLCCTIGPQGNMGQLSLQRLVSCFLCKRGPSTTNLEELKDSLDNDDDSSVGRGEDEEDRCVRFDDMTNDTCTASEKLQNYTSTV